MPKTWNTLRGMERFLLGNPVWRATRISCEL